MRQLLTRRIGLWKRASIESVLDGDCDCTGPRLVVTMTTWTMGGLKVKELVLSALALVLVISSGCGSSGDGGIDCGTDSACTECLQQATPYWCYADRASTADDPDMCENIVTYWGNEVSNVRDECINTIAIRRNDCSLCGRIDNSQIKTQCEQDCQ